MLSSTESISSTFTPEKKLIMNKNILIFCDKYIVYIIKIINLLIINLNFLLLFIYLLTIFIFSEKYKI